MGNYQYQNFKILEVSSIDAKKFLQGLATSNLNLLSNDKNILLTAFTNLKGRIISLCFVKFISNEKLLLSVEESLVDNLLDWFKKYSVFYRVNCSINEEYLLFFTPNSFLNHNILIKNSLNSILRFEEVQKQNILNKLSTINSTNTENFLPAELGLDNIENAVSYTKGCYMGQEVIARMYYKAKLKKELVVVKSQHDIKDINLKDTKGKHIDNIVNKVFIDNQFYFLVICHRKAS